MIATVQTPAADELEALVGARHQDPFSLLGLHRAGKGWSLRVFLPYATGVSVSTPAGFEPMTRIHAKGVFAWQGAEPPPRPVALRITEGGREFDAFEQSLVLRLVHIEEVLGRGSGRT